MVETFKEWSFVIPRNEESVATTIKNGANSSAVTTTLNKEQSVQESDTTKAQ